LEDHDFKHEITHAVTIMNAL